MKMKFPTTLVSFLRQKKGGGRGQGEITSCLLSWLLSKTKTKQNKKKQKITSVGEDVEKREPLGTISGNVKWCNHYGKEYGKSSNLKYNYHMIQQSHF